MTRQQQLRQITPQPVDEQDALDLAILEDIDSGCFSINQIARIHGVGRKYVVALVPESTRAQRLGSAQ